MRKVDNPSRIEIARVREGTARTSCVRKVDNPSRIESRVSGKALVNQHPREVAVGAAHACRRAHHAQVATQQEATARVAGAENPRLTSPFRGKGKMPRHCCRYASDRYRQLPHARTVANRLPRRYQPIATLAVRMLGRLACEKWITPVGSNRVCPGRHVREGIREGMYEDVGAVVRPVV